MDEAWHDTNLALARGDDSRAIGSDKSCLALSLKDVGDADHVMLRDALCDADDEWYFRLNGFFNACRGDWWPVQWLAWTSKVVGLGFLTGQRSLKLLRQFL